MLMASEDQPFVAGKEHHPCQASAACISYSRGKLVVLRPPASAEVQALRLSNIEDYP